MKRVWVHPAAWNEIGEVAEYYEKRREGLGERFFNELERVKSLLCEVQLGAKIDDRHRRAPLSGFPYSIIYRMPIQHSVHGADGGQKDIAATSPQLLTDFRRPSWGALA